jgi:DNA-binding transcriptional LysR family regulator
MAAHLSTRPLVRSTRKLTPTDAGAAYLAACRRLLEQVGDAERAASDEYSAPRNLYEFFHLVRGQFLPCPFVVT